MNTRLAIILRRLVALTLLSGTLAAPGLHAQIPVTTGLAFTVDAGLVSLASYAFKPKFYTTFTHNVTSQPKKASAKLLFYGTYAP